MRTQYLSLCFAAPILFFSCTKGNPGSNPNPGGGGGNGGGGANTITVTSISPANPYPDDEFIINGTGFNADATLDTVEFGRLINGNFGAWHEGVPDQYASLCTVVSASATQLKIKAVNAYNLDYKSFETTPASIAVAQVRTGGKKAVTPLIPFKRIMMLNGIIDPDNNNISWGRPADSLDINGKGYNKTGVSVSIGGTALLNLKVDSNANNAKISLRIPKTFFGEENDESITQVKTVTVTNADGKSLHKDFTFLVSPRMRIFDMHAENSSYSLSGLNGSGGVIRIIITGANLKSDALLKVDANNGIHNQSYLPVSGFPDSITIPLTPGALSPGTFQVSIWRNGGNTLYGLCNFILTQ